MISRLLSFFSGVGIGFYINKNIPTDPNVKTMSEFIFKKDEQQNIVINTSGIYQSLKIMLNEFDDSFIQNPQNKRQFAPKLIHRGDRLIIQQISPETEVTITVKEHYQVVRLEEIDKKHCSFWGCPKNRVESIIEKETLIQLPEGIKAKFK